MDEIDIEVRATVLAEARRILEPLPHVHVLDSEDRTARTRAYTAMSRGQYSHRNGHVRRLGGMKVSVVGWTQSLHAHYLEVECVFPKEASPASAVANSTAALTTFATRQRRRIGAALRDHGRDHPWDVIDGTDISEVDHMSCDRYTLEWLAGQYGPADARRHIGMMVTSINNDNPDGESWTRGTVYGERITQGDIAIDGSRLFYAGPVPEVLVGCLPGRPLSDLIDVSGAFGARRILAAVNDEDSLTPLLTVDIEPDDVGIAEHLDAMIADGAITSPIHA